MTARFRLRYNGTLAAVERDAAQDEATQASANRQFDLVVVCTGNRARSPIAEAFLRASLAEVPVRVRSVGTLDVGSLPPLRAAVESARAYGINIRAHRSRGLRRERLEHVDLVLGFERFHLVSATDDCGAPPERVFSMPELVNLLEEIEPPASRDPVARAREAVGRAHAFRIRAPEAPPEIADPLGGSPRRYRETVAQIHDLSMRLAAGLFGAAVVRSVPAIGERGIRTRSHREFGGKGLIR